MTAPTDWLAIDWMLAAIAGWIAIGAAGVLRPHNFFIVARVLFPLGAAACLLLAGTAALSLFAGAQTAVLPLGLPGLPFHLRLDPLSAFFLLLLGSAAAGVSVFAAGYFRKGEGTPPGVLCLLYHLFLAGMAMVLLNHLKAAGVEEWIIADTYDAAIEVQSSPFQPHPDLLARIDGNDFIIAQGVCT